MPKSKKDTTTKNEGNIELLKNDVASFVSSLGLASSAPSSGFNDADFRKKGPLNKPAQNGKTGKPQNTQKPKLSENQQIKGKTGKPENTQKPKLSENHHIRGKNGKFENTQKPKATENHHVRGKSGKFENTQMGKRQNKGKNGRVESTQMGKFGESKQSRGKDGKFENAQIGKSGKPEPKGPVLMVDEKGKGYERFRDLPKLPLMKASGLGVWYVDAEELEEKVVGMKGKKLEVRDLEEWKRVVEKKRELGERLMGQYVVDYESSRGQSGDIKMLVTTQRSGTAVDKVSAFSVMVGDNPVANMRSLDALLGMVSSKVGKRHALTGFEALKELFISSLLPDRKLKSLIQRPLNDLPETKDGYSLLLFWYWEDCLKQRYERFVAALEEASIDVLPILKDKALKIMYALLKSKSEQERKLLSALVNKLGDPQNRSASNADFHLSSLLSEHPNMKAVVIDEVDTFLFRPHLGLRAKYHGVNFLSQIYLSHRGDGPKVARRLIDVYFALFKILTTETADNHENEKKNKEEDKKASTSLKDGKEKIPSASLVEMDSRLLSALLSGVNRAFPYVSSSEADDIIEAQTPMLFKLVHSKNFNIGIQALMLLDKISSKNQIASDRLYRALYSKLLLPAAMNTSKAEMFIGLLLRAMKSDVNLKRVCAFAKRILQVSLQQPAQYACGCLFLLSEVLKARPPLWNMVLQSESADEELEHFEDIIEETDDEPGNKLEKEDDDVKKVQDRDATSSNDDSSDDEEEAPGSFSEDEEADEAGDLFMDDGSKDLQGTKTNFSSTKSQPKVSSAGCLPGGYDPRHREPSYSNADRVSCWELMVLASHVHPSVATMAKTLLSGANIVYNGNPLNDLSLTAFLDKFKEKKPKANTWHGGSQIEPAKQLDMNHHLIGSEILSLAEVDVPPEDLVFHKFYVNKMNSSKKPKKKKKKSADDEAAEEFFDVDGGDGSDIEVDGADESDNEEIEDILDAGASLEADGEYDYDDLDNIDDDSIDDGDEEEDDEDDQAIEGGDADDDDIDIDDEGIDDEGDDIDFDDEYDDTDLDNVSNKRKRKQKSGKKAGASPFASLEDYEHLLNEDSQPEKDSKRKNKHQKKNDGPTEKKHKSGKRGSGKGKKSSE